MDVARSAKYQIQYFIWTTRLHAVIEKFSAIYLRLKVFIANLLKCAYSRTHRIHFYHSLVRFTILHSRPCEKKKPTHIFSKV